MQHQQKLGLSDTLMDIGSACLLILEVDVKVISILFTIQCGIVIYRI